MKRNLKQKVASALIVSMMAGLTVSPAWGAENKPTWIFEDGVWHLYDKDGDLVRDGVKRQGGKWWAFDADGAMLTDQLYYCTKVADILDEDESYGDEDLVNSYIYPDGHMAENKANAIKSPLIKPAEPTKQNNSAADASFTREKSKNNPHTAAIK